MAASVASTAKSVKSQKTAIEVKAYRAIAVLEDGLEEKEAELEKAKSELSTIRKKIAALKDNWSQFTDEAMHEESSRLISEEIAAEDVVDKLEISLKLEKSKVERKKTLILLEKDADLEDIQSENDDEKREGCDKGILDRYLNEHNSMHEQQQVIPKRNEIENADAVHPARQQTTGSGTITVNDLVEALHTFGSGQAPQRTHSRSGVDYELPKFGGEPEKWIQFREEYDRTSRKYHLDDSENLLRLRRALVGQAKQTVQHLMANVRNVGVIMESLEKRFGRPRIVLNALATRAKTCSNVTLSKPESIIELGLAVQSLVTNIISFGDMDYLKNVELLDTMVKKLSPDLATRWFEWLAFARDRKEDLKSFADWTSIQLDIAYQRVEFKSNEAVEERQDDKRGRRNYGGRINTTTSNELKCKCCGKEKHSIDRCFVFKKKTVDDRWKTVKGLHPRICFCCLKEGHTSTECSSGNCPVDGCNLQHHKLLHNTQPRERNTSSNGENPEPDVEEGNMSLLQGSVAIVKGCDGPLPIVPVKLRGKSGIVKCHALLDTGASRSIMTRKLASSLGVTGTPICYSYRGITGEPVRDDEAQVLDCEVSGTLRGNSYYKMAGVVTVRELRMTPYSINMEKVKKQWPHLKNVAAQSLTDVVPDIIVGNNNPHLILARKLITGKEGDPIGWRSNLGWTIAGNLRQGGAGSISLSYGYADMELHELVKRSFCFEDFGVRIPKHGARNLEEKRAYEILENKTRKVDGKWETGLLWRCDKVSFPDTEAAALKRLTYVERKMKDPIYALAYRHKMAEYLEKGYMRKLSDKERETKTERTNIIAHFGHVNPNKPGKFRFILDAKAETNGVSLNSQLLKGPDLIQPLVAVLWNFRRFKYALTGDITDMFHRVGIRVEDQDSQRLLWRDGDTSREPDHYVMTVMIFGATCSPASAIYVKNRNAELCKEKYPNAAEVTVNSFYVDDVLTCCDSEEETIQLRKELSEIHSAGNFKICKWMSNSKTVIDSIPQDLRAEGVKDFEDKDLPGERILGLWWDASSDTFGFKLGLHKVKERVLRGDVPTKREMCGLIMSLYDPLGFIAQYKIKGLMLLQEVWRDGTGWDDEIQMGTYEKWRNWLSKLEDIRKVMIPRCYSPILKNADNIQLHIFTDASSEALSAVCYLRCCMNDHVEISFVNAKAGVAPLKKATIPRMELQAALLGCRLAMAIKQDLRVKVHSVHFWVDSSTVLFWIRSRAGKLKEFVANRVGEIQESTNAEQWHWVPTKLNVADQATRYDSEISFSPNSQWYKGPPFLLGPSDTWNFEEEKVTTGSEDGMIAVAEIEQDKRRRISTLRETSPRPENFSSYTRLIRSTAAVVVAARYWLSRVRDRHQSNPGPWNVFERNQSPNHFVSQSNIQPVDILNAERKLIKLAQEESFNIDAIGTKKDPLKRLSPMIDSEGFIRVDSRIRAAEGIAFSTPLQSFYPRDTM